jgi:hypothetical protein
MTNAQISVAKYSNDRHALWHEAQESFKALLIRSLGPTLDGTLGPPPNGFTLLTVQEIVNAVKAKYCTVDQMALSKMEDILTSPLDHLANLKQHMMMQIAAGYHIEEYRKVSIFKRSVIGHHQIVQCLQDFDKKYTDPLTTTYNQITAYVAKRLPTIRAAAELSASGATVRLAVYASHSASVKIRLSSSVRSTMVAMLAARFWMLTFHVKYINSGSCSRDTPISPAMRLVWTTLVVEDMVSGVE